MQLNVKDFQQVKHFMQNWGRGGGITEVRKIL